MINSDRMLHEFVELVRIDSPTKGERELAEKVKASLKELDLEVVEDSAGEKIGGQCGNLVVSVPGVRPGPVLMLSAHLDIVEPGRSVQPRILGNSVRSDGNTVLGADDKAGITAILEALRVLRERKIAHNGMLLLFSVAEEGGLNGVRNLDRSLLRANLGFVLDGEGPPGTIVNAAPGQDRLEVVIHGRSAHAGLAPEAGINAILLAARALTAMTLGRIDFETTANAGTIQGGRATNIVPDRVELHLEARSRDLAKLAWQTAQMSEAFERIAREGGGRAELQVSRTYEPFVIPSDAPVVLLAEQAALRIGLKPIIQATGGGSDANFFNRYGVPTVVLGVGMENAHTTEEAMSLEHLTQLGEWVLSIACGEPLG